MYTGLLSVNFVKVVLILRIARKSLSDNFCVTNLGFDVHFK